MNYKPSCPKCASKDTCPIFYGYPSDEEEYLQLVAEKKIHPGGCCIDSDSARFHCNNCEFQWGKYRNPDEVDSFDYDQGFNIKEVFDQ